MKYKLISSCAFLIIVYSSFAQKAASGNYQPRYYASITSMDNKIKKGVMIQLNDSSVALYPDKWRKFYNKRITHDTVVIAYSQIQKIKLKKQGRLLKGLAIGGVIGLSPIVFGQGGAFVAILTFPVGIITGAIVGATSSEKYFINGNYAAFNKMKKGIRW
jgi:hypothetical protein